MIVAFCGIDGAGKTTLIRGLLDCGVFDNAKCFRKCNKENADRVHRLSKPRHPHARTYLGDPLSLTCCWAYAFDFIAFYESIRTSLGNGVNLMDRWRPCLEAWIALLPHEKQCGLLQVASLLPHADLTFLLDVDPDVALHRLRRTRDAKPDETSDLLSTLRGCYIKLAASGISRTVVLPDRPQKELIEVITYHMQSPPTPRG